MMVTKTRVEMRIRIEIQTRHHQWLGEGARDYYKIRRAWAWVLEGSGLQNGFGNLGPRKMSDKDGGSKRPKYNESRNTRATRVRIMCERLEDTIWCTGVRKICTNWPKMAKPHASFGP